MGSPLSTLWAGSDGNGISFPGLTCGFRPLFASCISSILMSLDFVTLSVLNICQFWADQSHY